MKIKIYTNDYISTLEERVYDGTFKDYFEDGVFNDPEEETIEYEIPDTAPSSYTFGAEGNTDIQNAIALYETFPLTRIEAANRGLWTYLSLHNFAEYNKLNFNINKPVSKFHEYVKDHYLLAKAPSDMMRHTLCGLWWAVFLTVEEDKPEGDKYLLTKIMFRQKSFYARFLSNNLLSLKPAVQGMLQFIAENEPLFNKYFESRMRTVAKIINRLGGTKLIAAMDKDFFVEELNKRKALIEKATNRDAMRDLL